MYLLCLFRFVCYRFYIIGVLYDYMVCCNFVFDVLLYIGFIGVYILGKL